jgi:hypothetical protein
LKVAQLLYPYLIKNKRLVLQGLGVILLEESTQPAPVTRRDAPVSPGIITFELDKKAPVDEEFILYVSKETGKIKPLATSDVESFIETGKQLMNISKPFVLDGIGKLQRDIHNQIEFVQDEFGPVENEEIPGRKALKPKLNEGIKFDDDYMHPAETTTRSSGSKAIVFVLIVAGLGLIGWVSYFFYNQSILDENIAKDNTSRLVLSSPPADSQLINTEIDTTASVAEEPQPNKRDTLSVLPTSEVQNFKLVLEIASRNRAFKRFADLKEWGHKVIMTTTDSVQFKLAIPVFAPVSDSSRHRDSLSRFFGRKVWVETN